MSEYFRERMAALKMVLEIRRDYRQRYYHSGCSWDSRRGVLGLNEAEEIVGVFPSDIEIHVVTTGNHPNHRSRYRVKSSGESWLIQEVDTECSRCRQFGISFECAECGGTGWMKWKDRAISSKHSEQHAARSTRSIPGEELGRRFRDPAIEMFMADHFRERTAVLKKEAKIHSEYANRFCSPEFDWTRKLVSVEGSESEKLVNLLSLDSGVQVITIGFGFNGHALRYDLRPAGQSWLIWNVDVECPLCNLKGRSTDCFWCGGTGWDDAQAKKWRDRRKLPGNKPPPETPPHQP